MRNTPPRRTHLGCLPDHRLHGTRMEAERSIKLAIDNIKAGDTDKVNGELQDASRDIESAIQITEAR